jgi:outer membrane immunogenic protein
MKKITFILTAILSIAIALPSIAQGTLGKGGKQLNAGLGFSGYGIPIFVGMDFGVHESVTIGPRLSYRNYNQTFLVNDYDQSIIGISFNGNYHFNQLFSLPKEFDLYAGATIGYYIWSDAKIGGVKVPGANASTLGFDGQVGGRYFFNDKFALNVELGGGYTGAGLFGITIKL